MSDAFTSAATPAGERSRQRGPVATEAFVPATAGASRAVKVTAVSPIPPFFLMAHPERWAILRGKLRPVLGRLKLVPGVSGVERTRKGLTKVALARAHYEERGWQILPHTVLPPSQAARGSYICRPAGRPDVHLCYWQQVFGGSAAMRADLEMQDEFLDYLTDGDVIQPPEAVVVEKLLQQKRGEYEKAADKGQTIPSFKVKAASIAKEVTLLEKALAVIDGEAEPAEMEPMIDDFGDDEFAADAAGFATSAPAPPKRRGRGRK